MLLRRRHFQLLIEDLENRIVLATPAGAPEQFDANIVGDDVPRQPLIALRSIYTKQFGVPDPIGLTYSPADQTFLVTGRPEPGQLEQRVIKVAPGESVTGKVLAPIRVVDPLNLTADNNRLLFLDSDTLQVVSEGPIFAKVQVGDISSLQIGSPRGSALDPNTGRVYVLDGSDRSISVVETAVAPVFSDLRPTPSSKLQLVGVAAGELRGIAFNPTNGHLYVNNVSNSTLYELNLDESSNQAIVVTAFDLAAQPYEEKLQDPQAIVIAPSTDPTDDPAQVNLFVADSSGTVSGRIVEMSLTPLVQAVVTDEATLVNTIDVSQFTPPSPDSAGITYMSDVDRLLMSDSEVNEMPIYDDVNLFRLTRSGTLDSLGDTNTLAFSAEPTGVSYNPANRHLYVSDDDRGSKVFQVEPGLDQIHGTPDDTVHTFSLSGFNIDAEGLAYDTSSGDLFVADGVGREVHRISPGPDGKFDGVSDQIIDHFDVAVHGVVDPEGIGISDQGTLLIADRSTEKIFETTMSGTLLRVIDVSTAVPSVKPSGVVQAPASVGQGNNFYIVDRGVDNDSDPNENDGKIYEIAAGPSPPTTNFAMTKAVTGIANPDASDGGAAVDEAGDVISYLVTLDNIGDQTITVTSVNDPLVALTFDSGDVNSNSLLDVNETWNYVGSYVVTQLDIDTNGGGDALINNTATASTVEAGSKSASVNVPVIVPGLNILDVRVAASTDDAEEVPTGNVVTGSSDLELVSGGGNQLVGMRFSGLVIPYQANVTNAYVQFQTDETSSAPGSLTVQGQAIDNAPTFASTLNNISSRTPTSASVNWTPAPWNVVGEAGSAQQTPNIASVVQEIVNRPGWTSGNSLAVMIDGPGLRTAEAFDGVQAGAPLLHVEYTTEAAALVTQTGNSTDVSEQGVTDTYDVVLNKEPANNVTINITYDTQQVAVNSNTLLFTPGNWDAAQTVTVSAVDDALNEGPHTSSIMHTSSSSDSDFDNLTIDGVQVNITDNDLPGINVSPTSGLITHEAGGWDTFSIALVTAPTANVTIGLSSSDGTEGLSTPTSLTFSPLTWNTPQTVTVTGVDDFLEDGDVDYTIVTAPAVSADANYNGLDAADVSVTNTNDDVPLITTLDVRVSSGSDDAEQSASGATSVSSSDLEMVFTTNNQTVGMRFNGLNVPPQSNISNAYVQFQVDETSIAATSLTIRGQAVDNAPTFANTLNNITSRTPTAASVTWTPAPWTVVGAAGVDQQTSDITPIVQEIVSRPGWVNGNSLVLMVSGTGVRTAEAFEGDPSGAPLLHVEYSTVGITVEPTSGLTTSESGGTASFSVVLDKAPTAPVTIGLSSSDLSEGNVAPASLTFTPANWNTPQLVTATGQDDLTVDGNIVYTVLTAAAVSADINYNGLDPTDVSITNTDNDTAGITVNPTSGLTTTEGGGTATFNVALNTIPTANVTLGLSSSDLTEGTVAPASLTFNSTNWNTPQSVTVTGQDDITVDGSVGYTVITAPAVSGDTNYGGLNASDVSVTNIDDDTAGITVNPTTGLITTESGGTASFTVVLDTVPSADVSIGLSSSDLTEGTVAPTNLTFSIGNWNVPRTVTVTGVDDIVLDGNFAYSVITSPAVSGDVNYSGLNPDDVSITNTDDDVPGITVNPTAGLLTTENGGTDSFSVVLTTAPTANVDIGLTSDDATEGTVVPSNLTFTNTDWNIPQTVVVTGVDDGILDGNVAYNIITSAAVSGDADYNNLNADDVLVTNLDDDGAGITVSPTAGLTTNESGATATFTVVLNSAPTADVTIGLSSDDTSEGTVVPTNLSFNNANWSTPQVATVTGVDDLIDDGNIAYGIITAPAISSDFIYNGVNADDVTVTNVDDDVASVIVNESGNPPSTDLVEGGSDDLYDVALSTVPTGDVTITVSPDGQSDVGSGAGNSIALTFTPANALIPQTVTVSALDDGIIEGIHSSTISHSAVSIDAKYNGIAISNVIASIVDNDNAGASVSPTSGLVTSEAGAAATFTLVLDAAPTADVTIGLSSTDTTEGLPTPTSLTFTPLNWNTTQTVTVTGVDDFLEDGDVDYMIVTAPAASADANYNGLDPADVSVTNTNDDVPVITTLDVRVSTDSDDAEQSAAGAVSIDSSDLELVIDDDNQTVGMRFNGLNIPPQANITHAYVQFQVDETSNEATSLTIRGQAVDNAPTFADTLNNITLRTPTDASVTWSPAPWTVVGAAGPAQQTPDITAIIQEIVSRPGWSHGNSLVLTISGTGERTAEAFDGDPAGAPLLHVEYATGPGALITETGNSTDVSEQGAIDTYSVVLNKPPAANVTINITADTQQVLLNTNDLVFTPFDWNLPQNVTVSAVNDSLEEGPHTSSIVHTSSSADLDFANLTISSVDVNITDDDVPLVDVLDVRVAASADDAEQGPNGSVSTGSSDLELAAVGAGSQTVGMRFNGLNIPPQATITNAYVQFQVDETSSAATSLTIRGQAIDNAPTFVSVPNNITSRTPTTASVAWSPPAWPVEDAAGVDQQTPDITSVVQEIVSRPGWTSGNSIVLLITGSGVRTAEAFDGDQAGAPLLHVEYFTGSPLSVAPSNLPRQAASHLTIERLQPVVDEAIARLTNSSSKGAHATLKNMNIKVADLPGDVLGLASHGTVYIDRDAAGYGWYVDEVLSNDLEFSLRGDLESLMAPVGDDAYGRVDLLSAVMHELGHALGHQHSSESDLMASLLPLGVRRAAIHDYEE